MCTYRGGPAHPLLIQPPANYGESTLKVMYVGQETNGYENEIGSLRKDQNTPHSVETLLALYDNFTNAPGGFKYRGHFTNAVNSYQQAFSRIDPTATFTWNNVVKIGNAHDKGLPSETNLQWQDHWFDVIREEIRLLAPDVVLFFTGPRYDRFLRRVLPDVTFNRALKAPDEPARGSIRPSSATYQLAMLCSQACVQVLRAFHWGPTCGSLREGIICSKAVP